MIEISPLCSCKIWRRQCLDNYHTRRIRTIQAIRAEGTREKVASHRLLRHWDQRNGI